MSEHDHQVALFQWADVQKGRWPELSLLYAVPNGGKRQKGVAGKLKAEGVRSGVPDVVLPVARGSFHSLYIEMKDGNKKPSWNQRGWMCRLMEAGNYACICTSVDDAIATIKWYLKGAN